MAMRPLITWWTVIMALACIPIPPDTSALAQVKNPTNNPPAFPDSLTCTVQPYYRYRSDGKPGREVLLRFKEGKIYDSVQLVVSTETGQEATQVAADPNGRDSIAILLPPEVGVTHESIVTVTLRDGQQELRKTTTVSPMRHWTVYVFPHSHVDIGYSNTQANVEFIHKRNIDQGIRLAEATKDYPEGSRYLWNTEVMWPFERYMRSGTPGEKEFILQAVKKGELCLDAAYVNLLTGSCSDEEMIQALRVSREAARMTGKPIDTYVQVDIPGMSWGLVPTMAHEGIRYVMMMPNGGRGNANMVNTFDHKPFWWISQDGKSKVLFLHAGGYGAGMTKGGKSGRPWFGQRDASKIPEVIRTNNPRADFLDNHLFNTLPALERSNYPYDMYVVTWAMWDNALLDADLPEAVKSWNKDYAFPHLVISSAHTIMHTFETRYGDKFPVVKGDFTDYWTDGLGAAARETKMNRNAKDRLVQAEVVWNMLSPGKPAPRADIDEAWRYILLGTEHTYCYENPTEPYFQDAIWKVKQSYFREAEDRSQTLLDEALAPATDKSDGALGPPGGPSGGGLVVLNSLSWQHGGLVTLSPAESQFGDRVVDDDGKEMMSQRLSTGELVFLCPEVPGFGSRHFRIIPGECSLTGSCRISGAVMENNKILVSLDLQTGNIVRLEESGSGRNLVATDINGGLNAFRWQPARGAGEARPDSGIAVNIIEHGPLVVEFRIVSNAPGCRSLTRSVRLIHDQPWVEISNTVDKLPLLPKDGIHFGFGFNIPEATTRVDIPWGVMRLEDDQWPAANRAWATTQHFVDISNDTIGVTWCSLDAPLIESGSITANNTAGWDGVGDVWPSTISRGSTLYSWVMNNHWFTNSPLTQDGPVRFRYRLLPHGKFNAAQANRFGVEQAQPLIAVNARSAVTSAPIAAVANDRVTVTILKPSADGKSMIMRLRSFSDRDETVRLSWPFRKPSTVFVCDRGEEPGSKDASKGLIVPAWAFVTLRVNW